MKEGMSFGPQIKQQLKDNDFSTKLHATKRRAWEAFESISKNFVGNKSGNCSDIVK
jgi:hypothetical protein